MKKRSIAAWDLVDRHYSKIIGLALVLVALALVLSLALLLRLTFFAPYKIPPPPVFEIPPFPVSIAQPSGGDILSGLATVKIANPSGERFQKIEFWVDGSLEKDFNAQVNNLTDKLHEVTYRFNSRAYKNGSHVLSVRTVSLDGQYQTHSVTVRFEN